MLKAFLSYQHDDEVFVQLTSFYLRKQPEIEPFCYADERHAGEFPEQLGKAIGDSQVLIFFLGAQLGRTQTNELLCAFNDLQLPLILVRLPRAPVPPPEGVRITLAPLDPIRVAEQDQSGARKCAQDIVRFLKMNWVADDDLPVGYPFDYEKKMIEEYQAENGLLSGKRVEQGCPRSWPAVTRYAASRTTSDSLQETIGKFRKDSARILVDPRIGWRGKSASHPQSVPDMTFPEAGPREKLRFPNRLDGALTVGILVSGGIAPGINAVIASIVNRHKLYHKAQAHHGSDQSLVVHGYLDGFRALTRVAQDPKDRLIPLHEKILDGLAESPGSLLRTSRAHELLTTGAEDRGETFQNILAQLHNDRVEILYVIGGDGSMKAAHAIWHIAETRNRHISVVGIPKTMDNDILWVWQSFGFLSAVEKARETCLSLHTESSSNPRVGLVQLFGSDSGFVVSHTALASGVCDLALIPEVPFAVKGKNGVASYICRVLEHRRREHQSPCALMVMAETAIPKDAGDYLSDEEIGLSDKERDAVQEFMKHDRRVPGQTPDELRTAGLKIVSLSLQRSVRETLGQKDDYWKDFRVFTNEPRHLIRSLPPSVSDVIIGERLGALAVDNAMAGYTDFMVSQWLTEYVLVPLKLVVLGRKRVPKEGIFWKSVLASTGQPPDMCAPDPKQKRAANRIKTAGI